MIMRHLVFAGALAVFVTSALMPRGAVSAATVYDTGTGSIHQAGNWDNGLPDDDDVGTIAIDGIWTGNTFTMPGAGGSITVNHTTGDIDASANVTSNLAASGGSSLTWNMSDGSILFGQLFMQTQAANVTFNFSGGTLGHLGTTPGQRLSSGAGTFHMTGGVYNGLNMDATNGPRNFLGGVVNDLGGNGGVNRGFFTNSGNILIGGDFTVASSAINAQGGSYFNDQGTGTGTISIDPGWTGSLASFDDLGSVADWINATTSSATLTVGATTVTAGNFATIFKVETGTLSLLSPIPEPSTALLLGIGLLGLGMARRRRRHRS